MFRIRLIVDERLLRSRSARTLALSLLCVLTLWFSPFTVTAETDLPSVRVAVLKYGTANWELALMQSEGLDRAHGFQLELLQRVSPNASLVALQGGAADFTVGDWLWAARQQQAGRDYRFFPYSTAVGELLVSPDSQIENLTQLAGRTVGVAGGAEDKSWLLFQAYARRQSDMDLRKSATPRYAAPPLLNGLAETDQLDAVLTYWHYAARLKAQGFRSILSLPEVLKTLGVERAVPMLGWVFSGSYAQAQPARVNGFLAASYAAKRRLLIDDDAWTSVRPLMNASDEAVFLELREAYRAGVPQTFSAADIEAIRQVAAIVDAALPERRPADQNALSDIVFWQQFVLSAGEP